jgi:hypothetical protein
VVFSLDRVAEVLDQIGDDESAASARDLVVGLRQVDPEDVTAGERHHLTRLLDRLHADAATLAVEVADRHFVRKAPQRAQLTGWAQLAGWTLARDGSQVDGADGNVPVDPATGR